MKKLTSLLFGLALVASNLSTAAAQVAPSDNIERAKAYGLSKQVSLEEFIETVPDFRADNPKSVYAKEAYGLFLTATREWTNPERWKRLEELFVANGINADSRRPSIIYPPNNGGFNNRMIEIKAGMIFDRYQSWVEEPADPTQPFVPQFKGSFVAPVEAGGIYPFEARALSGTEETYKLYYRIEIIKDLPYTGDLSDIIPWFGQPGLGKQVKVNLPLGMTWNQLAAQGYVKITWLYSPSYTYRVVGGNQIVKQ